MGREVRRVPPDWEHPAFGPGDYQPMHDNDYETALDAWYQDEKRYLAEGHEPHWDGPAPDPKYYRPRWPASTMTAYQVYETVTEGTPISPVLHTREELIDWLMNDGSRMGIGGTPLRLNQAQAERFADVGYAPSMVMMVDEGGASRILSGVEAFPEKDDQ